MKIAALTIAVSIVAFSLFLSPARAQSKEDDGGKHDAAKPEGLKPEQQASKGSVTIAGKAIPYDAFAGTIVVHPKGWDDVPENRDKDDKSLPPEASMFYVAYFKSGEPSGVRPVTFFYNGGPGSSSVWLHMGAFGPKRVVTLDNSHTPAAPYPVVNNDYSLLDVSDLVFVDAPGTGFSRIAGKDRREVVLWHRCRRAGVRRFHRAIPCEIRTLEFAEIFVRRELWHDAIRGVDQYS